MMGILGWKASCPKIRRIRFFQQLVVKFSFSYESEVEGSLQE